MTTDDSAAAGLAEKSDVKLKYWAEFRSAIAHEDNLVNHRFSWLLTFEGFLMAGFFLVQSAIAANKMAVAYVVGAEIFFASILTASLWVCFISGQTISAAYRQTGSIKQAWERMFPEEAWQPAAIPTWLLSWEKTSIPDTVPSASQFPPIKGEFTYREISKSQRIPLILLSINVAAIIVCIVIAVAAWKHPLNLYAPPALQPAVPRLQVPQGTD